MGWFKVDDQLAFHAKVMLAGNSAMGLWIRAGAWSSAHLTDGFIPTHMAAAMANMANGMANPCDQDALVMAGLWDEVEGGYRFHDWEDFQPSADEEREKREKVREARKLAGKKGAEARWNARNADGKNGKRDSKPVASPSQTDSKPIAPTRPDQTNTEEAKASSVARAKTAKGTRLGDNWEPSPELRDAMTAECPGVDQYAQFLRFRDYWQAQPGQKGVKVSWEATYRNWIRRAAEDTPRTRPGQATGDQRAAQAIQAGLDLERMMGLGNQGHRELTG